MIMDHNIDQLLEQEFLITNGIGGYASSSIAFANTRRYHGLLVAASNPPTGRNVLVHKVEERIKTVDGYADLSTNKYGNAIYPSGFEYLTEFERAPIATWTYQGDDWAVTKEVMMIKGTNSTMVVYTNLGEKAIEIEVHPLFSMRDYHGSLHENHYDFWYMDIKQGIKVHPYPDSPPIYMRHNSGEFVEHRSWYKGFHYDREVYRGLEANEDSYRIGYVTTTIKPGMSMHVTFSDSDKKLGTKPQTVRNQINKDVEVQNTVANSNTYLRDLLVSGDQFLVTRAATKSKTILAGYHWFTDWGRDTMIAMRGLTISTHRKKESESILKTFFQYLDQGMLPNRFPDHETEALEYNTIDATLWLFIVMYDYYHTFNDLKFVKRYISDLESVIQHHITGTRYNIHVNDQGFVQGGEDGWQLTWMDAKVDGFVVTPRIGSPVEINVLWYNALKIFQELSTAVGHQPEIEIKKYRKLIKKNFKDQFLNDQGYLNDFIDLEGNPNTDFRCNQIYAVSLPFSLLTKKEEKAIVKQVGKKLLTDYGMRSLDQSNASFVGTYGGNPWSRDTAYHQGTVWTFVIGEYLEAYLKVNDYSQKSKSKVAKLLLPLKDHFYNSNCIHGISEVFDGDTPDQGRGCINQAWSVAALIKLYMDHPELNSL